VNNLQITYFDVLDNQTYKVIFNFQLPRLLPLHFRGRIFKLYNQQINYFDVLDNLTYKVIFNFQLPRLEEIISQAILYQQFILDMYMLSNCR
jgi:hypothetical protein